MLGSVTDSATVGGMMGAQGPALGIRRANAYDVRPAEQTSTLRASGGTIEFTAGAHGTSRLMVTQQTTEPITPLKTITSQESGKGQFVDTQA